MTNRILHSSWGTRRARLRLPPPAPLPNQSGPQPGQSVRGMSLGLQCDLRHGRYIQIQIRESRASARDRSDYRTKSTTKSSRMPSNPEDDSATSGPHATKGYVINSPKASKNLVLMHNINHNGAQCPILEIKTPTTPS